MGSSESKKPKLVIDTSLEDFKKKIKTYLDGISEKCLDKEKLLENVNNSEELIEKCTCGANGGLLNVLHSVPLKEDSENHAFCGACIDEWLGMSNCCPVTFHLIDKKEMREIPEENYSKYDVEVICFNKEKSCEWKGKLSEMKKHLIDECDYVTSRCENEGCSFDIERKIIKKHKESCFFRKVNCEKCNKSIKFGDLEYHSFLCEKNEIACPFNCGFFVNIKKLNEHINNDCIFTDTMQCLICSEKIQTKNYENHLKENIVSHFCFLKNQVNMLKEQIEQKENTIFQMNIKNQMEKPNICDFKSNFKKMDKQKVRSSSVANNENNNDINKEQIDLELDENKIHQLYKYKKKSTLLLEDGITYSGQWNDNNQKEGKGILKFIDGTVYDGEFLNDKMHGKGKMIHINGDVYEGDWEGNMASGYGIYHYGNGAIYKGEWKNDKQHGKGLEIWNDETKYEGDYFEGKKQGKGEFYWPEKSRYVGDLFDNTLQGFGRYEWADGRIYEGDWQQNKMHGKGKFIWPNGRYYEGEYFQDKKHGKGIFYWPDGKIYRGNWIDGRQEGIGTYEDKEGNLRKGVWEKGKRLYWISPEDEENGLTNV